MFQLEVVGKINSVFFLAMFIFAHLEADGIGNLETKLSHNQQQQATFSLSLLNSIWFHA